MQNPHQDQVASTSASDLGTKLFDAVYYRNVALVYKYIFDGADINYRNDAGNQSIHAAARSGSSKIVGILLKAGANVNAKGRIDNTPLHYAVINGDVELVSLLLDSGADPTLRNLKGKNPRDLCFSTINGSESKKAILGILDSWVLERCSFLNKLSTEQSVTNLDKAQSPTQLNRATIEEQNEKLLSAVQPLIADARKLSSTPQKTSPLASRVSNSPIIKKLMRKEENKVEDSPIALKVEDKQYKGDEIENKLNEIGNYQTNAEAVNAEKKGYTIEIDGKEIFINDEQDDYMDVEDEDEDEVAQATDKSSSSRKENHTNYTVILNSKSSLGIQLQEYKEYTRVSDIDPSGQAASAGVLKGDVLIEINGESMKSRVLPFVMKSLKSLDELTLCFARGDIKQKENPQD